MFPDNERLSSFFPLEDPITLSYHPVEDNLTDSSARSILLDHALEMHTVTHSVVMCSSQCTVVIMKQVTRDLATKATSLPPCTGREELHP